MKAEKERRHRRKKGIPLEQLFQKARGGIGGLLRGQTAKMYRTPSNFGVGKIARALYRRGNLRYNTMSGCVPGEIRNGGESMRQLDRLWKYQAADKKVADYETEIRQFPLRQQLLKLRNIVADQQTVVRGMENDGDKAEAALEEIKKSLADNAFETAAQVHRAIAQMADAEGKLKSAEKELSKMVSHSQMMENRYKEVRTKAAKARDEYTRLKAGYDKEFEKQTARLEELKQERANAAQGIDEAYMERYKAIRSQRFPVLASLRNDQCSGCNMSLPSAVAKQLQGSDEIVECENCGRILYIPDAAQEAE